MPSLNGKLAENSMPQLTSRSHCAPYMQSAKFSEAMQTHATRTLEYPIRGCGMVQEVIAFILDPLMI